MLAATTPPALTPSPSRSPPMPLEIRIDEPTWSSASPTRRAEWKSLIHQLAGAEDTRLRDGAARLELTVTDDATFLRLEDEGGRDLARLQVARESLRELMVEYVNIARQIARETEEGGLSRLEALDMGKKVVHDRGGRAVRRLCGDLEMDLTTARRLFSLLLSLHVDTTQLASVHGHRRR